jgi:hypothetical protein
MSGLMILWFSYAFVGWKLFWGDIIYYVVFLISTVAILFAMQEEPWIQGVFGYVPQAITVMLILSLLVTFIITLPATLYLVVLPGLSTLLAWQDMDCSSYAAFGSKAKSKIWRLGGIALLGLLVGEAISVSFLSSGTLS